MERKKNFDALVEEYFEKEQEMPVKDYPEILFFISKALEIGIFEAVDLIFHKLPPKLRKEYKEEFQKKKYIDAYAIQSPKTQNGKNLNIIIIGMTGSGKSSLINCLYAWSQGWQTLREFQHVCISTPFFSDKNGGQPQERVKNQQFSQTSCASVYEFKVKTSKNNITLRLMDTPGLGDTRGIQQDEKNIDNILQTIQKTPELNSIIIMVNGSEPRIGPQLYLAMEKIKSIIPNAVQDNVIVLLSNCDTQANLKVGNLGIQISKDKIFTIQNSIFSADPNCKDKNVTDRNDLNYQQSLEALKQLLDLSLTMKLQNTKAFELLREQREKYMLQFSVYRQRVSRSLKEIESCESIIQYDLKELSTKDSISDFKMVYAFYAEQVTEYHSTRCVLCFSNCHKNCFLNETSDIGHIIFKRCQAFNPGNGQDFVKQCMQCTHSYKFHVHQKNLFLRKEKEISFSQLDQEKFNYRFKQPAYLIQYGQLTLEGKLLNSNNSDLAAQKQIFLQKILQRRIDKARESIQKERQDVLKLIQDYQQICSSFNAEKQTGLVLEILKEAGNGIQGTQAYDNIQAQKQVLDTFGGSND